METSAREGHCVLRPFINYIVFASSTDCHAKVVYDNDTCTVEAGARNIFPDFDFERVKCNSDHRAE